MWSPVSWTARQLPGTGKRNQFSLFRWLDWAQSWGFQDCVKTLGNFIDTFLQVLSTRKRKDAVESEIKVQVCVFAFDILYLNGEALVRKPFAERRRLLKESFSAVEGEFHFAKAVDGESSEQIQEALEDSIKGWLRIFVYTNNQILFFSNLMLFNWYYCCLHKATSPLFGYLKKRNVEPS